MKRLWARENRKSVMVYSVKQGENLKASLSTMEWKIESVVRGKELP